MRTADGAGFSGAGFGSVLEALRVGRAVVDYLNSPAARELDGAACGEALIEIGAIASGLAAIATVLTFFLVETAPVKVAATRKSRAAAVGRTAPA